MSECGLGIRILNYVLKLCSRGWDAQFWDGCSVSEEKTFPKNLCFIVSNIFFLLTAIQLPQEDRYGMFSSLLFICKEDGGSLNWETGPGGEAGGGLNR